MKLLFSPVPSGKSLWRAGKRKPAQAGYGLMLLIVFITSTILIGASMQLVIGSSSSGYLGTKTQDYTSAKELAQSGMETVLVDIQSKVDAGTAVTTAYTYSSTNITMPTDPASLGGGRTTIGSFSATMTAARGNTYLVKITATVGSATTTYSRLISMNRTSRVLDVMAAPNVAYSLRKTRSAYSGSAIRVRRSIDNTEQDIGFDGNGNLDVGSLKTFLSATTKPVDSVSGATVAFGLRLLRSGYTANKAINVRRSSDNATKDIGFTSTGDLDVNTLMSFVGTGTGYVTTWYDQSGNGYDASQGTTGYQPTIVKSGVLNTMNNRPILLFDGVDDTIDFTNAAYDSFSILAVYSMITGSGSAGDYAYNQARIINSDVAFSNNDYCIGVDASGNVTATVGNPDTSAYASTPGAPGDNRLHWLMFYRASTTSKFAVYTEKGYFHGGNGNTSSLNAKAVVQLGYHSNSALSEVIYYSSNLTQANKYIIGNNQAWYYNMFLAYTAPTRPFNAISAIPANTVAHGLRKLYTGYNYGAINVRRSSDNTTQVIGWDADGNLDVTSLLNFVGSGSGYVKTLYDQTGGGKDLGQATAANQPRIVNNGVVDTFNGRPAMYFNGSAYLYTSLTANTGTSATAMVAATQTASQSEYARFISVFQTGQYDYSNDASASFLETNFNDNTILTERNTGSTGRLSSNYTFNYGIPFVATSVFDGSNGYLYLNGAQGNSYAYTAAFNYSNMYLGTSPTADYLVGYIAEDYVFPTALSTADRQVLERNLINYYSIPPEPAYVTKWYDQSGNGRDLTNTDALMQPSIMMPPYGSNTSYPLVMFNGMQQLYSTTGMPTSADYSKVAVFSYFAYYDNNIISSYNGGNSHALYTNGSDYLCLYQYSSCYSTSSLAMSPNTQFAVSGTYTEVTPTRTGLVYRSNTLGGTGSTGHSNGLDPSFALGAYNSRSFLHGSISEAMIFARSLSDADRTTIYNDERAYFGAQ